MDLNKAMIIGRLTRDPEVRNTPGGQSVGNFSLATNHVWKDASGQRQERPEYHDIVAWGKLAEISQQYLSKGRRVYIEGRLQTRDWTGNDGIRRFKTEIIAENMIMLDGPRGGGASGSEGGGTGSGSMSGGSYQGDSARPSYEPMNAPVGPSVEEEEIKVEDIPF